MKSLSIVICTYNRHLELKKVLEELFRQFKELALTSSDIKKIINDIELVIVDNNSTDETGSMIFNMISEKRSGSLEMKYIIEMEQGSSPARNRGIKESSGNVIAFLDDDILLDKHWLVSVYDLVKDQPKSFVRGCRVIALWSSEIPEWLSIEPPFEIIESCFPAHDYGEEKRTYPFYLDTKPEEEDINFLGSFGAKLNSFQDQFRRKVSNPISACFLASRDIFEKHGDFRLDLGIQGSTRGACEDTELFWRLIAAKEEVVYEPGVKVYHPIPATRMTKKFVLEWYSLLGKTLMFIQTKGLNHLSPGHLDTKLRLEIKLWIFRSFHLFSLLLMDPIKSFWFQAQISKTKGALEFLASKNSEPTKKEATISSSVKAAAVDLPLASSK